MEFPLRWNLSPFLSPGSSLVGTKAVDEEAAEYLLSSVVIHQGNANAGHYFCFIRPDPVRQPEEWIKLNDHSTEKASLEEVIKYGFGGKESNGIFRTLTGTGSSCAYLLQYTNMKSFSTKYPSD